VGSRRFAEENEDAGFLDAAEDHSAASLGK